MTNSNGITLDQLQAVLAKQQEQFQEQLQATLTDQLSPLNKKIGGLNAEIGGLNAEIGGLKETIEVQSKKIDAQAFQLQAQTVEINNLKGIIAHQQKEIEQLRIQNAAIAQRLDSIEDRLDLIDKTLRGIAPFVRAMLEADPNCLLLDPEWKTLRDSEPVEFFGKTIEIAAEKVELKPLFDKVETGEKTLQGLATSLGKKTAGFYHTILAYKPRKKGSSSIYHKKEEGVIVDNALRVARDILLA